MQLKADDIVYDLKCLVLIPYIQINGAWTISDDMMRDLYKLMQKGGSDKMIYASGVVFNEDDFIASSKGPGTHMVVFFLEDGTPAGIIWFTNFGVNYAYGHFCAFKTIWGTGIAEKAGKKAIDYFFSTKDADGKPRFDVILGIFPATNKYTFDLISKLGFTVVGEIPKLMIDIYQNTKVPAVLSYIERED